ncbi:hypothetical protein [Maridesulfovibrio sp. FT414]|uniref:hypothetical protein n=1 Tax=Maridesulfovibrio sp. FT414 TaxID=2979469 RepID=UPI003D8045D0
MECSLKKISCLVAAFVSAMIVVWFFVPKPELVVSIIVRMLAFGVAVFVSVKYREWKVLFLAAMFLLMALRQVLTLLIWTGVMDRNVMTSALSELPGFIVTILSLVSIIYIGLLLSGKVKLIEMQENNIRTLNSLLPICSNCRRIKNDEGYWQELEAYIEANTDSQFSHGLCRECSDELYGGQPWYEKSKKRRGW